MPYIGAIAENLQKNIYLLFNEAVNFLGDGLLCIIKEQLQQNICQLHQSHTHIVTTLLLYVSLCKVNVQEGDQGFRMLF